MKRRFWLFLIILAMVALMATPAAAAINDEDDNDDEDDDKIAMIYDDDGNMLVMNSDMLVVHAVVHKKMATGSNYIDGVNFDPVVLSAIIFSPSNMLSNTFSTIDIDTGGNSNVHSSPTIYAFGNDVSPGTNVQFWQVSDVDEVLTGANWTAIL